jgi:hypothetical protein
MMSMRTIQRLFWAAGIYGVLVVAPLFAGDGRFSADYPPAVTHPEFYYGFAVTVLGFQILYLVIGFDPPRFRPFMLLGVACKLGFAAAVAILHGQDRVAGFITTLAAVDAVLAAVFLWAWAQTPAGRAGGEFR